MKILFASEIEKAEFWLPLLQQAMPKETFVTTPDESVDIALVATPPAGTFAKLKNLKLIQSLWMGVERLLADPQLPRGVPLARLIDPGMVAAMSETVLAHVLDWHRHHYTYRAYQAEVKWHRHRQFLASDRTIGLLGLGQLGTHAASRLLPLGFNVVGWSRRPKNIDGVKTFTNLEEMLSKTDALVCLLPLTEKTKKILNENSFSKMKPNGCVINVARGGHMIVADLIAALDSGHVRHAYLDVFDQEPLPKASPLWKHPGVTLTPHAAALTEPRTSVAKIAENVERIRRGEPALNLVDFEAGY
jgi:glyoxylate/hydroxypyruvate reductase